MKTSFHLTIHGGKRTTTRVECWSVGDGDKRIKLKRVDITRTEMAAIIADAVMKRMEDEERHAMLSWCPGRNS